MTWGKYGSMDEIDTLGLTADLNPKERFVTQRRMTKTTRKQIGVELKLTPDRIKQVEASANRKMLHRLQSYRELINPDLVASLMAYGGVERKILGEEIKLPELNKSHGECPPEFESEKWQETFVDDFNRPRN